jgi:hypothetical protein
VTVETLVSDAVIWATYLLIIIGGVAGVSVVVVWLLARPGGRWSPAEARAINGRIVRVAVLVFLVAFFGGGLAGLFFT